MVKTKIETFDSSWNPHTGCNNNCAYCYARKTANRFKGCDTAPDGHTDSDVVYLKDKMYFTDKKGIKRVAAYPYGFKPTFHAYRLGDIKKKGFGKNIFVCSTGDLFSDDVPDLMIQEVFKACKEAPNHRYLFLTKNPNRYVMLHNAGLLPDDDNFWYGTTVTGPEVPFFYADGYNTFLSVEPIMSSFAEIGSLWTKVTSWIIVGAETGNRKEKVIPQKEWIEEIKETCKKTSTPLFMKDSLKEMFGDEIIQEFPWAD